MTAQTATTLDREPGGGEKPARLLSLDALRGLIMVLMALDHANHFVAQLHSPGEYWGGAFPGYSTGRTLAFLTRLVTHLAAPGFFFLMGVGMLLFARARRRHGWGEGQILVHFLIRGALLIALQLLVVLVQPTGDRMNVLKMKPPMCLTLTSADYFVEMLDRVLTTGW